MENAIRQKINHFVSHAAIKKKELKMHSHLRSQEWKVHRSIIFRLKYFLGSMPWLRVEPKGELQRVVSVAAIAAAISISSWLVGWLDGCWEYLFSLGEKCCS